jgi:hypothetical protein
LSGKELCTQAAPAPRACAAPAPRLAQWPPRAAIGGVSHSLLSVLRTPPELALVASPPLICPRCSGLLQPRAHADLPALQRPAPAPRARQCAAAAPHAASRVLLPPVPVRRRPVSRSALVALRAPRASRSVGEKKDGLGWGGMRVGRGITGRGSCGGMVMYVCMYVCMYVAVRLIIKLVWRPPYLVIVVAPPLLENLLIC